MSLVAGGGSSEDAVEGGESNGAHLGQHRNSDRSDHLPSHALGLYILEGRSKGMRQVA